MNPVCKTACAIALLSTLPVLAYADAYTSLTYGSGPDGYRSYSFTGDADITDSMRFKLDSFLAKATGMDDVRQTGVGLGVDTSDLLAIDYRYSATEDGIFKVKGNEAKLSFALDTLWDSDLGTTLDLGYGDFKYDPARQFAVSANRTLKQTRTSYGLSQDLTESFTLYGAHDEYKYDRNVAALALVLIRRTRNTSKAAFSLLSFPDKTNTFGATWRASDSVTLDASSSKTSTVLNQELRNTRLGLDYQASKKLNLCIAVTRSKAAAMVNRFGVTVQPETRDTYSEVTAGWAF
jgi:hypothetical protein